MDIDLGGRIRELREALNMRAQDLAEAVGLDPTAMSKIENGRRSVKSAELAAFAKALGVSPLALLDSDSLLVNLPLAARSAGRSIATGGAYDQLAALAELHVSLARGGLPTSPNLAGVPSVTGMHWLAGAQTLAAWAASELKVEGTGDQRFAALADAIQFSLGVDVYIAPFPGDPLSGAALTDHTFPLVFVNASYPTSRCLFTLAHEVGHLLAGHAGGITLDRELQENSQAERMANAFAANFLMPEEIVRARLHETGVTTPALLALMDDLGVSFESLVFQVQNLGFMDSDARRELQQIGWKGLRNQLASASQVPRGVAASVRARLLARSGTKASSRPPIFLLQRAVAGWQKGLVSIRAAASLLGEDPDDLLLSERESPRLAEAIDRLTCPSPEKLAGPEIEALSYSGTPI